MRRPLPQLRLLSKTRRRLADSAPLRRRGFCAKTFDSGGSGSTDDWRILCRPDVDWRILLLSLHRLADPVTPPPSSGGLCPGQFAFALVTGVRSTERWTLSATRRGGGPWTAQETPFGVFGGTKPATRRRVAHSVTHPPPSGEFCANATVQWRILCGCDVEWRILCQHPRCQHPCRVSPSCGLLGRHPRVAGFVAPCRWARWGRRHSSVHAGLTAHAVGRGRRFGGALPMWHNDRPACLARRPAAGGRLERTAPPKRIPSSPAADRLPEPACDLRRQARKNSGTCSASTPLTSRP
jgi:hypothetical protein